LTNFWNFLRIKVCGNVLNIKCKLFLLLLKLLSTRLLITIFILTGTMVMINREKLEIVYATGCTPILLLTYLESFLNLFTFFSTLVDRHLITKQYIFCSKINWLWIETIRSMKIYFVFLSFFNYSLNSFVMQSIFSLNFDILVL
jgi:hypothetical protein